MGAISTNEDIAIIGTLITAADRDALIVLFKGEHLLTHVDVLIRDLAQ